MWILPTFFPNNSTTVEHAFLSSRNSGVYSATNFFRSRASRRRSLTPSVLATRPVSPASRRLPASMKSFSTICNRYPEISPHGGTTWRCYLPPQAVQHGPDFSSDEQGLRVARLKTRMSSLNSVAVSELSLGIGFQYDYVSVP